MSAPRVPLLASVRLFLALVVVCVLLACAAAYAWWDGSADPDQEARAPISSARAMADGQQAAARLTERVLSYGWQDFDRDVAASQALLAPSFRSQYARTMSAVRTETVRDQLTLQARSVDTSVVAADDERVVALVFVDQSTRARGADTRRVVQNRVLVTVTRDGGEWRVSTMVSF